MHQSNGQSLPLSRSWNRTYLMGAAEKTLGPNSSLTLQGRIWNRLRESSGNDDNQGIENYISRAEFTGNWQTSKNNALGVTVRHSLREEARGSTRIDWMLAPHRRPTTPACATTCNSSAATVTAWWTTTGSALFSVWA